MNDTNPNETERTDAKLSRRRYLTTAGAVALTASIAGCGEDDDKKSVINNQTATMAGLSQQGLQDLAYPDVSARKLPARSETTETKTKNVGFALVDRQCTYGTQAGVDYPAFVRSTTTAEVDGSELNPLVSDSLRTLVTDGPFGIGMAQGLGVLSTTPDFEWKTKPTRSDSRRVTLLGKRTTVVRYDGSVRPKNASNPSSTPISIGIARCTTGGESVIAGIVAAGQSGSHPPSDRFMFVLENAVTSVEKKPPTSASNSGVSLQDPRLVQTVSETDVRKNGNTAFSVDDPDLVADEHVAPLFDVGGSPFPKRAYFDVDAAGHSDEFRLDRSDINTGSGSLGDVAEVFDANRRSTTGKHPSPFTITSGTSSVTLRAEAPCGHELTKQTLKQGQDYDVTDVRPMRVGFITCRDRAGGKHYGGSNGRASSYQRTVDVAVQYMQRVFPGGVYAYRHDNRFPGAQTFGFMPQGSGGTLSFGRDTFSAKVNLEAASQNSSFPSNGQLWAFGGSQSDAEQAIRNHGFDAWVLIAPQGYYSHHSMPNTSGKSATKILGHNLLAASAVEQDGQPNDRRTAQTIAHELGHFFAGDLYKDKKGPSGDYPMAQRDNRGSDTTVNGTQIDYHHARHLDSDENGSTPKDEPGVTSLAFDLTGGTFQHVRRYTVDPGQLTVTRNGRAQAPKERLESVMSYADRESLWTDSHLHQTLIDIDYGQSTLTETVLSAAGSTDDQGAVRLDSVRVIDSNPRLDESDESRSGADDDGGSESGTEDGGTESEISDQGSVRVEMRGPGGEQLASQTVSDFVGFYHGDDEAELVTMQLSFPETAAEVRIERDGVETRLNPIVRPLRDAVGRVPDRGFLEESDGARGRLTEALDAVESLMSDGEYAAARDQLAEFDDLLAESVRAEYDALAGQPDRSDLAELAERMLARLEVLTGTDPAGSVPASIE